MDRVKQLKSWLSTRHQTINVVLISGDIADGPMDWNQSEQQIEKYKSDLDTVVTSFLEVNSSVYYIPGNVRHI